VKQKGLPDDTEELASSRLYGTMEMSGASYQLYFLAKKAKMKWYAMHAWQPAILTGKVGKEGRGDRCRFKHRTDAQSVPGETLYDPRLRPDA